MAFCAYCGTQLAEVSYAPCPNCGNPSNGAPAGTAARPVAASRSGSNTAMIVIFVIVGVFAVIAIIGILAAIAIPNFMTATERAKQRRTLADMRSIATAVEAYSTDKQTYPQVSDLTALQAELVPTYMRTLPIQDAWTHAMKYECVSVAEGVCNQYGIGSAGKDGQWEHESLRDYLQGPSQKFDCDIVYRTGTFIQYPEGIRP